MVVVSHPHVDNMTDPHLVIVAIVLPCSFIVTSPSGNDSTEVFENVPVERLKKALTASRVTCRMVFLRFICTTGFNRRWLYLDHHHHDDVSRLN